MKDYTNYNSIPREEIEKLLLKYGNNKANTKYNNGKKKARTKKYHAQISVNLEQYMKDKLEEISEKNKISQSDIIREAIADFLNRYECGKGDRSTPNKYLAW